MALKYFFLPCEDVSKPFPQLGLCFSEMNSTCVHDAGSYRPAVAVDVILHIYAHCTGALVQNGKLGLVVEKSCHLSIETEMDILIHPSFVIKIYSKV